jgi:hypothetical protein
MTALTSLAILVAATVATGPPSSQACCRTRAGCGWCTAQRARQRLR